MDTRAVIPDDKRLMYWRTASGAEIDILVLKKGRPIIAIECKMNAANPRPRKGFMIYIITIVTLILAACAPHALIPNRLSPFGKDVVFSDDGIVRESYLLNITNKEIDYTLDLHTFGAR